MSRVFSGIADKVLSKFMPSLDAGACIAPDPYNRCVNHVVQACQFRCDGSLYCSNTTGRC